MVEGASVQSSSMVGDQDLRRSVPATSPTTIKSQKVIPGNFQGGFPQGTPQASSFVPGGHIVGGAAEDEDRKD
jgi:hypothetical protein